MALGVTKPENGPEMPIYIPGQGARFITVEGDPILPSDVSGELALIDPDLRIDFIRGFGGTNRWILKRKWRQSDKRWSRVQSGEITAEQAFDLEHDFPRDCPTSQMVSYVRARYGERNIPRDPRAAAERMMEAARKLMAEADAQNIDTLVEQGTRKVQDDTDHQRVLRVEDSVGGTHERAAPMVMVNDAPRRLL